MPLRHPGPQRSRTMVGEYQSQLSTRLFYVIPLTAILGLVSLFVASALGLPQKDYFCAFLVVVGVFLVLVNALFLLRSRYRFIIRRR